MIISKVWPLKFYNVWQCDRLVRKKELLCYYITWPVFF